MDETPSAFFSAVVVTILAVLGGCSSPSEAARAFFVFGDSLVDNGNNNYLATTARADAPPYGIDTPSHRPSGRFSNGRNIPDIISWVSQLALYKTKHIITHNSFSKYSKNRDA